MSGPDLASLPRIVAMAGEDLVELAREGYERGVREGIGAILPFTHEDIRIEESPGFIDTGTFHGHEGLLRLYGLFTEQFDDFRMAPVDVFAGSDDHVVVVVHLTGVAKQTRIPLKLESFHVHTVEEGKSSLMRVFLSRADAMQAAGLDDVSVVRKLYEAIPDRLTGLFELLDPDIEWHEWKALPNARVLHGHGELRPYLETLADGFERLEFEPNSFREVDGAVVAEVSFSGVAKQGSDEVSVEVVHVWELKGGRVARMRVFGTLDEALAEIQPHAA